VPFDSDPVYSSFNYIDSDPVYSLNWATKAHNYLLNKAYGNELTEMEMAAMEAGSRYADSPSAGFQEGKNSFMHSMTSAEAPDAAKMAIDRDEFIKHNVTKGANLINSVDSNVSGAFFVGFGMHALMDQYSPAHMGENQFWRKRDFHRHGPMPTSLEGMRSVTSPQYAPIVDKMRALWMPN
jgi:hypothetical protein